ncbi:MAG: hypothetical protein LOD92_09235, partial [Bacillales bacterium]
MIKSAGEHPGGGVMDRDINGIAEPFRPGSKKIGNMAKLQLKKLEEGEKAINLAKEQIEQGEASINAGLSELNKNKADLENQLNSLNQKEQELKASESALLAKGDKISEEEKIKLGAIQESLKELSKSKTELGAGLKA